MDALSEKIRGDGLAVHERVALVEELVRLQEREIANPEAPSAELGDWHMAHFDALAEERMVVQKVTVSTGMFIFAISCRERLRREEAEWREVDPHPTIEGLGCEDLVPAYGEPLLFMSCSRLMSVLRALRKGWNARSLDPERVSGLLSWGVARLALLLTYPFDGETFDDGAYRQRMGDTDLYLANLALVFDAYAIVGSLQRDLWLLGKIAAYPQRGVPTVSPKPLDEARAWRFMDGLMGKVQGDSLCTQFQKAFIEMAVCPGDALLFARRRPSAIAPTHMDLIAECHGVEYSRETHGRADVRLVDVYREPAYAEVLWLVVIDYYFRQKVHYPWLELHVVHRLETAGSFGDGGPLPRVVHLPAENGFGVQYAPDAVVAYGGVLQAILRWMAAVPASLRHKNVRYDIAEIVGEFI